MKFVINDVKYDQDHKVKVYHDYDYQQNRHLPRTQPEIQLFIKCVINDGNENRDHNNHIKDA